MTPPIKPGTARKLGLRPPNRWRHFRQRVMLGCWDGIGPIPDHLVAMQSSLYDLSERMQMIKAGAWGKPIRLE